MSKNFKWPATCLVSASLLAACGGGGGGSAAVDAGPNAGGPAAAPLPVAPAAPAPSVATSFEGSFAVRPSNRADEAFDRVVELSFAGGNGAYSDRQTTTQYSLGYPQGVNGGCSISGGSGETALSQCVERASGQLLGVCQPDQAASESFAAVLVRTGSAATLEATTLAELRTASGASGVSFTAVGCGGQALASQFTVNANGSATVVEEGLSFTLPPADVDAAFSASGLTQAQHSQSGLQAYKQTAGGITRYYLVEYGAPLPDAPFSDYRPALFVGP